MKHQIKHIVRASILCASLASFAANATAQDTKQKPATPQQTAASQNTEHPQAAAENTDKAAAAQPTFRDTINAEDTVYDPSLLNEEISKKTTKNTKAAREILEDTHDTEAIAQPPKGVPDITKMQGLPGEEFLNEQVEQISELNEIRPGQPMTLREALLKADESNIDLESARVNIDKAQAQLKQAWAVFLPNVSGKLTYAHLGSVPSMDMSAMTEQNTARDLLICTRRQL